MTNEAGGDAGFRNWTERFRADLRHFPAARNLWDTLVGKSPAPVTLASKAGSAEYIKHLVNEQLLLQALHFACGPLGDQQLDEESRKSSLSLAGVQDLEKAIKHIESAAKFLADAAVPGTPARFTALSKGMPAGVGSGPPLLLVIDMEQELRNYCVQLRGTIMLAKAARSKRRRTKQYLRRWFVRVVESMFGPQPRSGLAELLECAYSAHGYETPVTENSLEHLSRYRPKS